MAISFGAVTDTTGSRVPTLKGTAARTSNAKQSVMGQRFLQFNNKAPLLTKADVSGGHQFTREQKISANQLLGKHGFVYREDGTILFNGSDDNLTINDYDLPFYGGERMTIRELATTSGTTVEDIANFVFQNTPAAAQVASANPDLVAVVVQVLEGQAVRSVPDANGQLQLADAELLSFENDRIATEVQALERLGKAIRVGGTSGGASPFRNLMPSDVEAPLVDIKPTYFAIVPAFDTDVRQALRALDSNTPTGDLVVSKAGLVYIPGKGTSWVRVGSGRINKWGTKVNRSPASLRNDFARNVSQLIDLYFGLTGKASLAQGGKKSRPHGYNAETLSYYNMDPASLLNGLVFKPDRYANYVGEGGQTLTPEYVRDQQTRGRLVTKSKKDRSFFNAAHAYNFYDGDRIVPVSEITPSTRVTKMRCAGANVYDGKVTRDSKGRVHCSPRTASRAWRHEGPTQYIKSLPDARRARMQRGIARNSIYAHQDTLDRLQQEGANRKVSKLQNMQAHIGDIQTAYDVSPYRRNRQRNIGAYIDDRLTKAENRRSELNASIAARGGQILGSAQTQGRRGQMQRFRAPREEEEEEGVSPPQARRRVGGSLGPLRGATPFIPRGIRGSVGGGEPSQVVFSSR